MAEFVLCVSLTDILLNRQLLDLRAPSREAFLLIGGDLQCVPASANKNLPDSIFARPLLHCQVVELKEVIVWIVPVFKKINYGRSATDKENLRQARAPLIKLRFPTGSGRIPAHAPALAGLGHRPGEKALDWISAALFIHVPSDGFDGAGILDLSDPGPRLLRLLNGPRGPCGQVCVLCGGIERMTHTHSPNGLGLTARLRTHKFRRREGLLNAEPTRLEAKRFDRFLHA